MDWVATKVGLVNYIGIFFSVQIPNFSVPWKVKQTIKRESDTFWLMTWKM
jgi:hypothetical protein